MEQCANFESRHAHPQSGKAHGSVVIDVRGLANFVLDIADRKEADVSNMALNKILYFVHCDYLLEKRLPLVSAKIEAWEHGPVFREVYHEFKKWVDQPIKGRATRVDPDSGEVVLAEADFGNETEYLKELVDRYITFSAAHLRAISHRVGGPWHEVWGHDGRTNPGMKISNEIITENYARGARQ